MADEIMNALIGYYGSKKARKGVKKASKIIGQTADENVKLAKDIYGQNIEGYQPFTQFGYDALGRYSDAMKMAGQGDFSFYKNTPDYLVGEDAMRNALNRDRAMRGKVLSPSDVDDTARMMADYSLGKYQDWRRGAREDIGIGYPAIGSVANERTNMLNTIIPQNIMKGEAKAGSNIVGGNIWAKYMEDLVKGFS
jgi:hypothetical protein